MAIKKPPTSVFLLCKAGSLLVGSYAKFLIKKSRTFNDFDLIVPPEKWYIVSLLIPKKSKINKHGGFKFTDEKGNSVDIWPCSINQHLEQCKPQMGEVEYIVDYMNEKIYASWRF